MVLVVGVIPVALVVQDVHEKGNASHSLVHPASVTPDGKHILLPPPPDATAAGLHNSPGVEVAAHQPSRQLTQFHLAESGVGLSIESARPRQHVVVVLVVVDRVFVKFRSLSSITPLSLRRVRVCFFVFACL